MRPLRSPDSVRRLIVDSENSGFNLIDALAIDKDSAWIEKYRDEYDKHLESMSLITDTSVQEI